MMFSVAYINPRKVPVVVKGFQALPSKSVKPFPIHLPLHASTAANKLAIMIYNFCLYFIRLFALNFRGQVWTCAKGMVTLGSQYNAGNASRGFYFDHRFQFYQNP